MYNKNSANPPFVDGKHNMTCLQLCDSDDFATMMTVDAVLGFSTHKMDKNYNATRIDKKLREKCKDIMQKFIANLDFENTYRQLIAAMADKVKFSLKTDDRFKRHIFRFLYLFDRRSGIRVSACDRYENEGRQGAAIFATKEWPRGSQVSTLFGCIAEMRADEEDVFHESKNEFSVMYSTRKNCSQLWLGPAAYVNHDCKPNCRFTEGNDDSKMTLETLRNISPGDELLIYYGDNFFGPDNGECECFTCELSDRGLFSRHCQTSMTADCAPTNQRRVATRATRAIVADPRERPQTIHSDLHRLTQSTSAYSLRVTYSRIDRVKRRILSGTITDSHTHTHKPKLKCKSKTVITPSVIKASQLSPHIHLVDSSLCLRQSQRQRDSKVRVVTTQHGRARHSTSRRITRLSSAHSTQHYVSHLGPTVPPLSIVICCHDNDTANSDRPSCSASSPTIPVLETESDLEQDSVTSPHKVLTRLRSQRRGRDTALMQM